MVRRGKDKKKKKNKKKKKQRGCLGCLGTFLMLIIIFGLLIYGAIKITKRYINVKKELMNINHLEQEELMKSEEINPKIEEQVKVIALFGTDERINNESMGVRADTIMICSIDTINKKVNFVSIPRDTYVEIGEYGKTKINHAYSYGREQLAIQTINNNFELAIDEYVTINFSGIINVVNSIGGINLKVTKGERDFINTRIKESYALSGNKKVSLKKYGDSVHLNGEQALAHARNRTIGNDFERGRRQRDIMEAIITKVSTLNLFEINELINTSLKEVKTNVDVWQYIKLIPTLVKDIELYKNSINTVQLPSLESSRDGYINGVYYFIPDMDIAIKDFKKYVYGIKSEE